MQIVKQTLFLLVKAGTAADSDAVETKKLYFSTNSQQCCVCVWGGGGGGGGDKEGLKKTKATVKIDKLCNSNWLLKPYKMPLV